MRKLFKSKIGLELVIPLILVFGTILILIVADKPSWLGLAILLPVILFVVHIFLTTNYVINGHTLIIKCGFLFNRVIDINKIKKISETNNPLSSPATSLDRIEIIYGTFDSVIISPKLKKEFINEITRINTRIEVKYKDKSTVTPDISNQ